jgi:hypothetical protein
MNIARALLAGGSLCLATTGCVQKAYDRTVVYELDVSALDSVKTVGLRGDDRPLVWQQDQPMTAVVADSLYRTTVTYHTGYRTTDVKFTVNGTFEFDNGDNRRVPFEMNGDTTIYRARFNVRP